MRLFIRSILISVVLPILLSACGGGDGGDDDSEEMLEAFPPQTYNDDFDSGTTGERWLCGSNCGWDVVSAGPLNTVIEVAAKTETNFVFQSPDPMVLNSNRQVHCEGISARFEEEGTFAFDYFIKTAGPLGFQDGNNLEVTIVHNTVVFDPDFEDYIPTESVRETVLELSGETSSRFQKTLPPGFYDFRFCYDRNRTGITGPDFVQIDNVDTCVGTSCAGEVPDVARCLVDQGATVVPDLGALPTNTFTLARAPGATIRYYLIIDAQFLEFISSGFASRSDPLLVAFKAEVDGVLNTISVDGKTCDVDERTSLLIEMTAMEVIDLLLATGILQEAFEALKSAVWSVVTSDSELKSIIFGAGIAPDVLNDVLNDFASDIQQTVVSEVL